MSKRNGILLMNLGSPDSTSVKDVKKYLNEFLMDKRVIDISYIPRLLLVKGLIVPTRASKSAEAYQSIWTENGSPLVDHTRKLQSELQKQFSYPVEIAMRYGSLTPQKAFEKLLNREPGLQEVIAVPLYPHYAMSSYETAVEYAREIYKKNQYPFELKFVPPYYNDDLYIRALAENMLPYLQDDYDHVLFSYHGVPARHIRKSDVTGNHCLKTIDCCQADSPAHPYCYRHQCLTTTMLVTSALEIPNNKFSISFQSRLGKGWLQPFTDIRLQEMPAEGIKNLLILCPAFISDCLETLEEIEDRGKEIFLNAGGESYTMIPCLNEHPLWIKALSSLINKVK